MIDKLRKLLPARLRGDMPVVPVVRLSGVIGAVTPLRPGMTLAGLAKVLQRAFEPVARALPALVRECLTWDTEPVRLSLILAGVDPSTAYQVVRECYGGDAGADRIADICRATVRVFRSAGVLDVPGAAEAFAELRLIP